MSTPNLIDVCRAHPETIAPAMQAIDVLLAREDVNAFAEYCLRDKDGSAWVQQDFHRQWHAMVPEEGPAYVVIGAPREHAKTTQMSVADTIWRLGRDHNLRIKQVAANDDLARDILHEVRENIERNPRVHEVFPDLKPDFDAGWAKEKLFVQRDMIAKDPSVEAAGILSTGAGGRADIIKFDDVVDLRNAILQPALRDQVKRAFHEVWLNLLGPDGIAIYMATVWHQDDLTCDLKDHAEWAVWWQPAIDEESGGVLWPDKWDREALDARKRKVGPRIFARQFLLIPLSDDESTFSKAAIEKCRELGKDWAPGQIDVPAEWPRVMGVDLASSLGKKAAYTVIFVIAVDPNTGRRYPLEIHRERMQFPETVKRVTSLWEQHHAKLIMVENNAFQDALVQQLVDEHPGIPVQGFTTGRNKADEQIGLPGLSATMANGGWVIPSGGEPHPGDCPCAWCAWERELSLHPVAKFTDTVMAMWFADSAAGGGRQFAEEFQVYF